MDINASFDPTATTELCKLMMHHGSDKSVVDDHGKHNYTTFYNAVFGPVRDSPLRIFELGIGTTKVWMPSSMGPGGCPGASLRGWRDYFPNAQIYGADIDRDILISEERITTRYCDQLDPDSIRELWEDPELAEGVDIIVEDGLHNYRANKLFFEYSAHKLRSGGVYVIEDLTKGGIRAYENLIETWRTRFPDFTFRIMDMSFPKNEHDNILLVVSRK